MGLPDTDRNDYYDLCGLCTTHLPKMQPIRQRGRSRRDWPQLRFDAAKNTGIAVHSLSTIQFHVTNIALNGACPLDAWEIISHCCISIFFGIVLLLQAHEDSQRTLQ